MIFSDSPIQRYTPPTCTLEIWAKRSPLSLWSDRDLVKDLRFVLHFDDPRLPEEKQLTIKGDRTQLQQLCDLVTSYVQNTLLQPSLSTSLAVEATTSHLSTMVDILPAETHAPDSDKITSFPISPTLQPKGLLTHEFSLGSLEAVPSVSSVQLSVSQLFDLVDALEQFSTDIEVLPALNKAKKRKATIVWGSTAAAAILAVGITALSLKMYQIASGKDSNSQSNVKNVVPPVPNAPDNAPVPSPTLPPTLNRDTLPPPPTVQEPPAPPRTPSVPVVVPPYRSLPPAPNLPKGQNKPTVAIVPNEKSSSSSGKSSVTPAPAPMFEATPTPKKNLALPALPPLDSQNATPEGEATNSTPQEESSPTALVPSTASPSNRTNNLLDTIPQVAEVREYFQQRWQAPQGLNQRIEYRLTLNREGAIARIMPLGKAASIYLDRTQMPLMNTAFVSPLEAGNNATIRLVLSPDGEVKTFLEE
jgi:hypothetical protein